MPNYQQHRLLHRSDTRQQLWGLSHDAESLWPCAGWRRPPRPATVPVLTGGAVVAQAPQGGHQRRRGARLRGLRRPAAAAAAAAAARLPPAGPAGACPGPRPMPPRAPRTALSPPASRCEHALRFTTSFAISPRAHGSQLTPRSLSCLLTPVPADTTSAIAALCSPTCCTRLTAAEPSCLSLTSCGSWIKCLACHTLDSMPLTASWSRSMPADCSATRLPLSA